MKACALRMRMFAWCAMMSIAAAVGDDDDKAVDSARLSAAPGLSAEQRRAVGILVAHPLAAKAPERIEGVGLVLDAMTLVSDVGDAEAAAAEEQSTSAELARLRGLFNGGAGTSRRVLEAAQAEQAKAQALAQLTAARFALHWGPLAALPIGARRKIIEAATDGRILLLRTDMPGRHVLGAGSSNALLDVDGIEVPGRVLGVLRQTTEVQGIGLLVQVPAAPAGLGAGARIPVALLVAPRSGLLVPRDALLYDEKGAYVYKQLTGQAGTEKTRYAPLRVNLLMPYGDGWLVDGVDDDDEIVVHGAGVLWSLQGVGPQHEDDDD